MVIFTDKDSLNIFEFCANRVDAEVFAEPTYSFDCHTNSFKILLEKAEKLPKSLFSHINTNNERVPDKHTLENAAQTRHPEFMSGSEDWGAKQQVLERWFGHLLQPYIYIYIYI